MHFQFIYENKIKKPVKIVLRRGEEDKGKQWKGVNLSKTYCKHICKYHNVYPSVQLLSANEI
jgi:hypothetical protein